MVRLLLDAGDVKAAAAEWSLMPVELIAGFDHRVSRSGWPPGRERSLRCWNDTVRIQGRAHRRDPAAGRGGPLLRRDRPPFSSSSTRELDAGRLTPANFLGLAEVKLQRNDMALPSPC